MISFHKDIIRIHKSHKEFLTGSLKYLDADYNVIAYGRFNKMGKSVILVNNNDYEITKELSVWYLGIPKECMLKQLLLTTAEGYTTENKEYPVVAGKVSITIPKTSAIILRYTDASGRNFVQFEG